MEIILHSQRGNANGVNSQNYKAKNLSLAARAALVQAVTSTVPYCIMQSTMIRSGREYCAIYDRWLFFFIFLGLWCCLTFFQLMYLPVSLEVLGPILLYHDYWRGLREGEGCEERETDGGGEWSLIFKKYFKNFLILEISKIHL